MWSGGITLCSHYPSVLIASGCLHKLPQSGWLKAEVYFLTALETRSPTSRVGVAALPPEAARENLLPSSPSFWRLLHPLAGSCVSLLCAHRACSCLFLLYRIIQEYCGNRWGPCKIFKLMTPTKTSFLTKGNNICSFLGLMRFCWDKLSTCLHQYYSNGLTIEFLFIVSCHHIRILNLVWP